MIKIIKLITTEDIIGDVIEETAEFTKIKAPARFVGTGNGLGLIPYCPFSKSEVFTIKNSHIVASGEPEDEIYSGYNQQFGSGLVLAGGNLRLTPET